MAAPTTEHASTTEQATTPPRAAIVIGILFLIFFLGSSDNQMISPLLPLIADEFGITRGALGSLIGPAYALAAAAAAILIGPLSDRYGRRRFLLYGCVLFGASLISVRFISDPLSLASLRLLTGLAAGTFSTCSIAYVGDYFPYKRRGVAMSIVQAGYFAALVVGVQVANNLASTRGWRMGFEAFGMVAVVAFLLVLFALPEDKHHASAHFAAANRRFDNIRTVFETSERVASIAAAFFVSGGFVGFFLYLVSWLKELGFTTRDVDVTFFMVGIALLLGVVAAGWTSDRLGKRGLSIAATITLAAMLFLIPRTNRGILLYASISTAALAFAFRQGPLQALATELVPRRARGTLVAARNTASQIGIAFATWLCGGLFDKTGYHGVGIFSGLMSIAAAVCIFIINEPKGGRAE
jgi:predicted MFS family arabinose efflux permease